MEGKKFRAMVVSETADNHFTRPIVTRSLDELPGGDVLIKVINRRAFGWQIDMSVSAGTLATALVFAAAVALLAGVYPAWRAGRSQPAVVMREE